MVSFISILLMVPFLYAFPLLLDDVISPNDSSIPPPIVAPGNTSLALGQQFIDCFEPKIGRLPTSYQDCEMAATEMLVDFVHGPITLSRRPIADIQLPKSYRAGTCVVYLDMLHDSDIVTLSTAEVLRDTMILNMNCVGRQDRITTRLGGVIGVGSNSLLYITMYGRRSNARGVA